MTVRRLLLITINLMLAVSPRQGSAEPTTQPAILVDLSAPPPAPITGHLKMGGKNPQGVEINANSQYLTMAAKPWLPVMGEFHFSRYPHEQWEEELLKMKAGGVTIVSTYVFWIHHEEVEGRFDWTGDRNLREFVQLCAKHGLYSWVRLGPWCHGEVRNGGLPDWVLAKCKVVRKDDPIFMGYVRTLYTEIAGQLTGLYWKDGGPIVGVQVENEMTGQPNYLLALKHLAQDVGIDVPLYSVTGWGGAQFPANEVLPLFGGYADGFWEGGSTYSKGDRKQFFFTPIRDDSSIGADLMAWKARGGQAAQLDRYPYVTCECGGGMELSYARRPLMTVGDVVALSLVKVGSGSNLPGYYMYQGGANLKGKLSTLQESQATKYPNDMPVISYDFQAPLGEFGQVRPSYHGLRMLHQFLADFGSDLATMPPTMPPAPAKGLEDTDALRWAARSNGERGFLFINNYQRGQPLPEKTAVQFNLKLHDRQQQVPSSPITIPSNAYMIWPFNLDLNGVTLQHATAQLLCRLDDAGTPCFVFFALPGIVPEFAIDAQTVETLDGKRPKTPGAIILPSLKPGTDCLMTWRTNDGRAAKILLLTQEQALRCWKADLAGSPRLVMSAADLSFDGSTIHAQSNDPAKMAVSVYPALPQPLTVDGKPQAADKDGVFTRYSAAIAAKPIALDVKQMSQPRLTKPVVMGKRKKPAPPEDVDYDNAAIWQVKAPSDALSGVHDVLLKVKYQGDVARAYVEEQLIDDNFYYGEPWEMGLRNFPAAAMDGLTIKILPLRKDSPIYLPEDRRPEFDPSGQAINLEGVSADPVYEVQMQAGK